ncbi:hypothetical protein BSLG_005744 [Batrachochytrium salamandrivorans]|nr:hypothetical protein BSLG_005744 [Batrachochytrium salamandrivorans]
MSLETLAATASLTALNHTTPTKPLLTNPTDSTERQYTGTPSILADLSEVNEDLIDLKETLAIGYESIFPNHDQKKVIPYFNPVFKINFLKCMGNNDVHGVTYSADTVVDITPPQLVLPKLTCIEHDSVFNSASSSNNIVPVSDKSSNQSLSPLEVKTIQLKIEPDTKITCITDL